MALYDYVDRKYNAIFTIYGVNDLECTISHTAYCFHTFISSYKVFYILYYFTTDVINIMKCPTDE